VVIAKNPFCSGVWRSAITVIAERYIFFVYKLYGNTEKCIKTLKNVSLNLKGQCPLKFKKMSSGTMANHELSIYTNFDPY
jgi:hypothetical protein